MIPDSKITNYVQSTLHIIVDTLTNSLPSIGSPSSTTSPAPPMKYIDLIQCGINHKKSCNFKLALHCFNSAIAINSLNDRAFTELGLLYIRCRDFNNAAINFNLSLDITPDNITSITGLAYICREKHSLEKSLEYYNLALEIDPFDNSALIGRIILNLRMKNIEAVIKDEETLMHSKPSTAVESEQSSQNSSSPTEKVSWEEITHADLHNVESTSVKTSRSPIPPPPLILRKPIKKYLVLSSRKSLPAHDDSLFDPFIERFYYFS